MSAGPRILVLGREGQVARSLADLGRAAIVCVGRPEIDLRVKPSLERAILAAKPDVVINAAAYTAVDKAESEEAAAFAVNEAGARNAAQAAREAGLPLLHLSTDYVFDGTKGEPYEPNDPPYPINAYGRSKLAGEIAVLEGHPESAVARTAWVVSPYGTNFVRTMLRLGRERAEIGVVDDQRGTPTAAADLAGALADAAARAAGATTSDDWGIYHLAGPEEATWFDFAEAVFAAAAGGPAPRLRRIATSDYSTPARRAPDTRLASEPRGLFREAGLRGWRSFTPEIVGRLLAQRQGGGAE